MKYHNCGELANHYSTKTVNTIENPKQGNSSLFFLEVSSTLSANQKQNMIMVTMFFNRSRRNKEILQCFVFLSSVFDTFSHSANQKQNLTMVTMFFYRLRRNKEIS
jgi:hypothetical protein